MHLPTKRTALITGASRGLGLALARRLAADGWTLLVDARSAEPLEQARQELAVYTQVLAIAGDIADPVHRAALARAASDRGGLDLVVNNAGMRGAGRRHTSGTAPLDASSRRSLAG